MQRLALNWAAAAFALAALAGSAHAQDATAQPKAAAEAPAASPSHTAAAVAFLRAAKLTKGFEEMIPAFLDQVRLRYVSQRPEVANLINDAAISLVPEFVQRQNDLVNDLAKLYTSRFTEEELQQLTDFYKTPIGTKLADTQAGLLQASVPLVQNWTRKLTQDMTVRIKEEVKKKGAQL